jgi:hypothetical protein
MSQYLFSAGFGLNVDFVKVKQLLPGDMLENLQRGVVGDELGHRCRERLALK